MNVIENKIPHKQLFIEPLGNAWAVYSMEKDYNRMQEDVFNTLDEARNFIKDRRNGK